MWTECKSRRGCGRNSKNGYTMFSPALLTSLFGFALQAAAVQIFSAAPVLVDPQICITAGENADGAPLVVQPCSVNFSLNQEWRVTTFSEESSVPSPMVVFGDKCIDVPNGHDADGTPLQVWTCEEGNPNQQWISVPEGFQWNGTDKCIDLTNGNTALDTILQIWTCENGLNSSSNLNQEWIQTATTFGLLFWWAQQPLIPCSDPVEIISHAAREYCIIAASADDGTEVTLARCDDYSLTYPNGPGSMSFIVPAFPQSDPINLTGLGKCLDVTDGVNADGTKLQVWSCVAGNPNQQFTALPGGQIEWTGTGKCLDVTNGQFAEATPIQVWDCATGGSNPNQQWDLQVLA
ncbi:ricin B lectin domain-containing protein [Mycena sanguinolenta]|nr:ricin B lectin domain-containing protein [Mycena sanguinolenta]